MYRSPRAVHLLTHYRHCQQGTMKQIEGVKEKKKGDFSPSTGEDAHGNNMSL